jgi:hypothetical protein
MTIIYAPEHIDAAAELRDACAALYYALDHEPAPHSPLWEHWNQGTYQPAYARHLLAESTYARMFPAGRAPHSADVIASAHRPLNPLRLTHCDGVYKTRDERFWASSPKHISDTGAWRVAYYPDGYASDPSAALPLDARDLAHAQQIVDLITWATSTGARNGEN